MRTFICLNTHEFVSMLVSVCVCDHAELSPGLGSVAVEDLVGSDQVQLAVALFKHVDARQPASRGDQSLLHGRWIHQLPI